jgi:3-hydroxyacyl-[acyl-carrier-protein] dehydratase
MPGVIVVEALAQLGGIHLMRDPQYQGKTPLFLSIDRAKFRRQVVPGDVLRLEIKVVQSRRGIVKMEGRATVAGNVACEVAITAGVV